MFAAYFNMMASSANPITVFTRASHPPLLGSFFRYPGNAARKKNGNARPVAKLAIPSTGCKPFNCTDAAKRLPTKGPTQANDVSENVSPINSVPKYPPRRDAASSFVSKLDGSVISNAPSKLNANAANTIAMNPFTHGFDASCTTPNGPTAAVTPNPRAQNSTTMPSENTIACRIPPRSFRKNETVIGIIGQTQGVKIAASPNPN